MRPSRKEPLTKQDMTSQDRAAADSFEPQVAEMTAEERREYVEKLGNEIAEWSAELNRRLA